MSIKKCSDWEKQDFIKRLKKAIENSKNKVFEPNHFKEWIFESESLGYHIVFDHAQNKNPTLKLVKFRLLPLAGL